MPTGQLILEITIFGLAVWLGFYLIARNPRAARLRYAGLGVIAYALSLGTDLLAIYAPTESLGLTFGRLHWPLLFLPAFFWLASLMNLLDDEAGSSLPSVVKNWQTGLLLTAIPFYLFSAGTNLIFDFRQSPPQAGPAYPIFAAATLLPLLIALGLTWRVYRTADAKKPIGLIAIATIFFGLSAGLLVFPLGWLPRGLLLLAISLDFIVLGITVAWLDAFDEGETLLLDFAVSFDSALFGVLLFGGLVGLTMVFSTGLTFAMLTLLLGTITSAIAVQTFGDALDGLLDRLAFAAFPNLRQARAELRTVTTALPRVTDGLDLAAMNEAQFARLTRRALSHMGDLSRLATSPLIQLPLIDSRLTERNARDNTLERAAELKRLLAESIARLKPPDKGEFGTTDEWRYYNALYFPYVVGLRPYSRRADYADNGLTDLEHEALDWLRTYVPERTLYNWQTAGAKLIAQDLRERLS